MLAFENRRAAYVLVREHRKHKKLVFADHLSPLEHTNGGFVEIQ